MKTRTARRVSTSIIRDSRNGTFESALLWGEGGEIEVCGKLTGSVGWLIREGLTIRHIVDGRYQPAFYGPVL